jgi:hypothetical protein
MGLLSRAKDAALERAAILFLSPLVKRYGKIRRIGIDTEKKEVSGEIQLHGDVVPLELYSAQYNVVERDGDSYLVLSSFKLGKEWIQNLSDDLMPQYTVKIPGFMRPLLE